MEKDANGSVLKKLEVVRLKPPPKVDQVPKPEPVPPLSEEDQVALTEFDKRSQALRDLVVGCVRGAHVGAHIDGPPGVSKSYTILDTLNRLKAQYFVHQRISAQPLFYELKKHPGAVHVIEDCEGIFKHQSARTLLRSALGGQRIEGHRERHVVWAVSGWKPREESFYFWGSIVFTSNRALNDADPEVRAIMSRIPPLHFAPTDAELKALMRHVARQGFKGEAGQMTKHECVEVIEHVISTAGSLQCPLDLRWIEHAYGHYLTYAACGGGTDWRDMVRFHMMKTLTYFAHTVETNVGKNGVCASSRQEAELQERCRVVARLINEFSTDAQRVAAYVAETRMSSATYYRDLKVLRRSGEGN
jgi:hypothetical protein